jgi:hypothetical protein
MVNAVGGSASLGLVTAALVVAVLAGCGGSSETTTAESSAAPEVASTPSRAERLLAQHQRREARQARREARHRARRKHRKAVARRRARAREAQEATAGIAPLTEELYEQFHGVDRDNFQVAYETCGSQPMSQSAEEWETSDDPTSIAHAFGLEYRYYARPAVEEGCLRAFSDSQAQYEAELEAHSKL